MEKFKEITTVIIELGSKNIKQSQAIIAAFIFSFSTAIVIGVPFLIQSLLCTSVIALSSLYTTIVMYKYSEDNIDKGYELNCKLFTFKSIIYSLSYGVLLSIAPIFTSMILSFILIAIATYVIMSGMLIECKKTIVITKIEPEEN